MKYLITICTVLLFMAKPIEAQEKNKIETCTFSVSIDCQGCIDTITKDLAFVKGVRDLQFSLEEKTVAVTYRNDKVSKETLAERIKKLGYKVEELKPKEANQNLEP